MPVPPTARGAVGRALIASAIVLVVLAALVWTRALPIAREARQGIAALLGAVALMDVVAGWWFLRRSR